jgi:hypothetical protein
MSTPAAYVTFLNRNGVKLWVDNGQLHYHAKKGILGSEELARLRSMRTAIVAELTRNAASAAEGPVSFQQRWFLRLLEAYPNWPATLSYIFHLQGALDPATLERSLEGILCAHPSLRTRVVRVCGEWRQQIEPRAGFQLPITQVSGETEAEKQHSTCVILQKMGARELDPLVDRLLSAQLVRVSAQEHFLLVLIHRLATDCVGMGQAFRDLWASYAQTAKNGCSTNLEESTRYRDYALWQHTTDEAWRQKHAAYWNDYLAGAQCIRWPMRECAARGSLNAPGRLMSLESPFGETLSAGLIELGRQKQTLPALIMLSVYVVCVSMWCDQKDLVIPFLIAGRGAAHEGLVGCFSHVVYLRIRLKGGESFAEVLKLVSNEFYRAAAFRQDSGRMATERPGLLQGTLCQWLSWHPADIAGFQAVDQTSPLGLRVHAMRCQNLEKLTNAPPERVDLEINFFDAAGEISALAIYRTDRFAERAVGRLMEALRSTAEHAVIACSA